MEKKKLRSSIIYVTLIILFCYLPIFSLMIFSFNSDNSLTNWQGFSLRWYKELFSSRNAELQQAIYYTVVIAILATLFSVIIGTFCAISLTKSRKIFKEIVLSCSNIPVLNPEIVTAVSLLILFTSFGIATGFGTMLLAHVAFCTPYVIITVYPKLRSLDPNLLDAAQDLGASPFRSILKVIIPQIKFAIISGAFIAFTMSFDDFVISYFTSSSDIKNISIYLYGLRPTKINPMINALSTIIIVLIFLGIIGNLLFDRIKMKKGNKNYEKNNI